MNAAAFPLILEPGAFARQTPAADVLVVDLSTAERYAEGHLPGAVHLEYGALNASRPPVGGLLPDDAELSRVFSAIGLSENHHVIAYDEEGGGKASRLLWTLDVIGHRRFSLLDGGWRAWSADRLPVETRSVAPTPSRYVATVGEAGRAGRDYIMEGLGAADLVVLDVRTPREFSGEDRRSERGGHIPGAVNFNWVDAMDPDRALRLRPKHALLEEFAALGVTPDKEVVAYCQTHRRSSHTYIVLKSLGFERVRGYPGSWSEWGNDPSTPVEI